MDIKRANFYKQLGFRSKKDFMDNYLIAKLSKFFDYSESRVRKKLKEFSVIENKLSKKWFNKTSIDIYNGDYIYDCILCFITGSRRGVSELIKFHNAGKMSRVNSIIDYGAGVGLTTMFLAMNFPKAKVYYYNLPGDQVKFFKMMLKNFKINNIEIIDFDVVHLTRKFDVVICLEFFEHFKVPMGIYKYCILNITKKYLIEHSGFRYKAIGHFKRYLHNGNLIQNDKFIRHLTKAIKVDFNLVHAGFNGMPRIFLKK